MNTLSAEKRDMQIKAKKLRREGFVTGNVFGKNMEGSMPLKIEITPPEITRIQEVPASISPTRIFCPFGGSSSAERPSTDNVEATDAIGSASVQKLNVIVHKNKIVINLLHGKVPII